MSTWKRAFLYTVRKKVKTVILFFAAGNVHIYLNWTVYL